MCAGSAEALDRVRAAPAGQVLRTDKVPFLLRQIESRKKAEVEARKKAADQERAKAAAKAAKRPSSTADTPEPKRQATEDGGAARAVRPPGGLWGTSRLSWPACAGQQWTAQKLRGKTNAQLGEILRSRSQKVGALAQVPLQHQHLSCA